MSLERTLLINVLYVGLGGFIGAALRYITSGIVERWTTQAYPYGTFVVNMVGCLIVAETVKLLENTFRSVNIGLVNEIAMMCNRMGINVWEVIDAAATKPFGFMPFYPGPGLGGHCIPIDPHYLSWKLKSLNYYARFIELAGDINSQMPEWVVERITSTMNLRFEKALNNASILILGVSYKKNIKDIRESPAVSAIKMFVENKMIIRAHDPEAIQNTQKELGNDNISYHQDSYEALDNADALVIFTDWPEFRY